MEIITVNSFLDYYKKIWNRTKRVTSAIPQEKLYWKPNEKSFSFAEILTHLVNLERYMFAETVLNNLNKYPGHKNKEIEIHVKFIKKLERTFNETYDMISTLSDYQLEERCTTPDGTSIRIWKWLRAMIEHHIHHRAQIYTYLNLIDIQSPPLYGLTSEQVKERST